MADNKKSFLLYTDLKHTVSRLSDKQAGALFKHILAYVNDENPSSDDLVLNIAFEPIKQQLKRDLASWEKFRDKQRENGKKGGRPETQKNPKNPSLILETQKSLNVNATVNDTVTVNATEKKIGGEFSFDFLESSFSECFLDWVKFRKEIKEPFLHQAVLESSYKKLVELSKNIPAEAEKIIKQSKDKGWKHLYALEQKQNGTTTPAGTVANF